MKKFYYLTITLLLLTIASVPWQLAKAAEVQPSINSGAQPKSVTIYSMETLALSCTVLGGNVTIQWQKQNDQGGWDNIGVASSNTNYVVTSATAADDGNYRCIGTNSVGSVTSNEARVTFLPDEAPKFVSDLAATKSVNEGSSLSLSVKVTGGGTFSYVWKKDGVILTNGISGINAWNSSYAINPAPASASGVYTCEVTNGIGTSTSVACNVTVATATAPATSSIKDKIVLEGASNVTWAQTSTGTNFQWQKKVAGNWVNISGATDKNYVFPSAISASDAGSYRVLASNSQNTSDPTISVNGNNATVFEADLTVVTAQPQPQSVNENGTLTLSVGVATPGSSVTYQWYNGSGSTTIPGATSPIYTKTNVTAADAGKYRCIIQTRDVSASGRFLSTPVDITVLSGVAITTQPTGQTINEGEAINLSVAVTGTAPTYQWKKDGVEIAGATSATYSKLNASLTDAGNYTCVVANAINSVNSESALVTVNGAVPVIKEQSQDQTVVAGSALSLSVTATTVSGTLTYQWKKDGVAIAGATSATYSKLKSELTDAGKYVCEVTNASGTAKTADINVSIFSLDTAPTITTPPQAQIVIEGKALTLSVVATGTNLNYQWKKDDVAIVGATSSTYTKPEAALTDAGKYTCLVYNTKDSQLSAEAVVTITPKPVGLAITVQPTDKTVNENDSLGLSITVTGSSPTYQWKKDNNDIAGATASVYSVKKAALADAGTYTCVVTNELGSVTSQPITVAVNKAEVFFIPVLDGLESEYVQNATLKIELKVKGIGSEVLTKWFIDGSAVSAQEDKFYLPLSLAEGKHLIKAETTDGKFNIEKTIVIKK